MNGPANVFRKQRNASFRRLASTFIKISTIQRDICGFIQEPKEMDSIISTRHRVTWSSSTERYEKCKFLESKWVYVHKYELLIDLIWSALRVMYFW